TSRSVLATSAFKFPTPFNSRKLVRVIPRVEVHMKSLIVVLAMMIAAPAFAKDVPASEASVRKMMELSKVRDLLDGVWNQMETSMDTAIKTALNGRTISPEQQKLLDDSRDKMFAILREELSWEKLEPIFIA